MTINLQKPDITELKPKITVFGVGGGGGNAVNNMITGGLEGVEFVVANTDAQALTMSKAQKLVQLGVDVTEGLGAGSQPDVGRAAAEECIDEISDYLTGTHMAFVTAGMGGGTGTGAAPVVARAAREMGVLTVGVVTKPFHFEGGRRMTTADEGIAELQKHVDTLIVIPNQNLFRIANDKTTFADAFGMADQVLYSGVACITDLMVKEGLINLDFADVRSVMREMGKAMMGTGEASGEGRAMNAAEAAISNPLLDETSMRGAQGLLISITGGRDLTLFEVDEAATRIREEIDSDANIILGATFDEELEGVIRVSVVATGIDKAAEGALPNATQRPVAAIARPASTPSIGDRPQAAAAQQAASVSSVAQQTNASRPAASPSTQSKVEQTAKSLELPATNTRSVEKDGVKLEPFRPANPLFNDASIEDDFKSALEEELQPASGAFVPAAAQEPETPYQPPRIPDVEDFPPLVKAEVQARQNAAGSEVRSSPAIQAEHSHEDRGPLGLLKKLKSGFVGREEEAAAPAPASPVSGQPAQQRQQSAPQPRVETPRHEPAPRAQESISRTQQPAPQADRNAPRVDNNPYAPRKAHLDDGGRQTPETRPVSDDDQLDIPAFLRRQAN